MIHELYGKVAGIRMNGSAALALCYVAAGRFDAWLEAFIGKWDFSAAALMVLEAGGKVTDFLGNENFIEGHHIIATNGPLHPLFCGWYGRRCHSDTVLIALLHFLWKTHLKPGSCPLSISSSRVSVLYAGALCKREKRAFASGVI